MRFGMREILFLLLLVAIPVGAWWFVFHPRNIQIAQAKEQIQAKRLKLQALNRATATIDSLKSDIQEYNRAIDFFQSKLPAEKEMDKVLREVWELAQACNLTAKSVRTEKRQGPVMLSDTAGPYAEQPVCLELDGDFNSGLYSFLLALEKKARITRIHTMTVEKNSAKDDGEGLVHATLVMSIFFERNGQKE
jgi:type IV pilus assembly protein PilO